MSNIEGDGIMELIYYLLWRKDSPYNEQMNISIPDTVIFKKGRPINWYFTDSEGTMLKKKQSNINYDSIIKKFTHKVAPGEIAGCFIHINDDKKFSKFMNIKGQPKEEQKKPVEHDDENLPEHPIEYFDSKALIKKFKNGENCMDMNGILQKFIDPYGDHNELIQAIWSPRLCVFTKRVNLRRLNETHFDVYERALTFDGPAFYSKNVPLRGGYIPGKLRATCDMIVQHIAHISFEKIIMNRLVAYFKVDKKENVWFLWTTSIRVKETSKMHRNISEYIDKPLCLEPLVKTPSYVRLIQTNFSTRPANLQMNDQCAICGKQVTTGQLVPVQYKHLLGNDEILKRSEAYYIKEKEMSKALKAFELTDPKKPQQIKRNLIGVPVFIKVFHPEIGLKDYQILREKEHFLMQKTNVCDECFLIVSQKYQGGYPFKFTVPQRPKTSNVAVKRLLQHDIESNINVEDRYGMMSQDDGILEESLEESLLRTLGDKRPKSKAMKIDLDDLLYPPKFATASTAHASTGMSRNMLKTVSGTFLQTPSHQKSNILLNNFAKDEPEFLGSESPGNTTRMEEFTSLRSDILKALGGNENKRPLRAVQSAVGIKAQRPQSQGVVVKEKRPASNQLAGRKVGLYSGKKSVSGKSLVDKKYELSDLNELFDDSSVEGLISLEENLLKSEMQHAKERDRSGGSPYFSRGEDDRLRGELMHELHAANRIARLEQQTLKKSGSRPSTSHHGSKERMSHNEEKYINNKLTYGTLEKTKREPKNFFMKSNYQVVNKEPIKLKKSQHPRQKLSKTHTHSSMGNIGKDLENFVENMVSNREWNPDNVDRMLLKNKKKLANYESSLNTRYYETINHLSKDDEF